MTPERQHLLDLLTAERFAPHPERPADNSDGPSAQELPARDAARDARVVELRRAG